MTEFLPPIRATGLRIALAILVTLTMLVPAIVLASFGFETPQVGYAIAGGELRVTTGFVLQSPKTIPLASIRESVVVSGKSPRRTKGTALAGYCVGDYHYADLGDVWQATDCATTGVLLRLGSSDRPVFLTPPDRDDFLSKLRAGEPYAMTLPRADKGPLVVVALFLCPLLAISAAAIVALMLLGPSKMRYELSQGELRVSTIFGSQSWSVRDLRARAYVPSRIWRIAGAGMPGYYTGRFRENGASLRVYATDLSRAVLIEGSDRVLLSPEDRDGFLAAMRREGAIVHSHG